MADKSKKPKPKSQDSAATQQPPAKGRPRTHKQRAKANPEKLGGKIISMHAFIHRRKINRMMKGTKRNSTVAVKQ